MNHYRPSEKTILSDNLTGVVDAAGCGTISARKGEDEIHTIHIHEGIDSDGPDNLTGVVDARGESTVQSREGSVDVPEGMLHVCTVRVKSNYLPSVVNGQRD